MQLRENTKIAGKKTVADWNNLKKLIINDFDNESLWEEAYHDFFETRLKDRYLNTLDIIKNNKDLKGEGFAMMVIICSLIEFLESTYQGKNYVNGERNITNPQIQYSGSKNIFIEFLTNHTPFKEVFDQESAKEFYVNVRCGLLHEARTKGKWKIRSKSKNKIIENKTDEIIIYRNNFYDALKIFIEDYKNELVNSKELKEAFIRKYDNICQE